MTCLRLCLSNRFFQHTKQQNLFNLALKGPSDTQFLAQKIMFDNKLLCQIDRYTGVPHVFYAILCEISEETLFC